MSLNLEKCLRFMLYIIIIETILGGAGRLFVFHSLSIRMMLYGISFVLLIINLFIKRKSILKRQYNIEIKIVILLAVYLLFSSINGYVFSRNSLGQVVGDLTGYSSLAMIFIFTYIVDDKIEVDFIIKLISICIIIQAIIILGLHYLLGMGILNFNGLNDLLQNLYLGNLSYIEPDSIRIFFKSSIYLEVGFVFILDLILKEKSKKIKWIYTISLVFVGYAIILSFTRGFWISAFILVVMYGIFNYSKNLFKTIGCVVIGMIIMFGVTFLDFGNSNVFYSTILRTGVHLSSEVTTGKNVVKTHNIPKSDEGVDLSLAYRDKLKKAMFTHIEKDPILGNGFGVVLKEIGQKESRCEYMFLDIIMEMGIVGFCIYISIFVSIFIKWIKIKIRSGKLASKNSLDVIIIGLIGIMITSFSNPFLNNPLGIIYLLFVISAINTYRKDYVND